MEYQKSHHSVYRLSYHAVFVIKYRRKVIDAEMMEMIRGLAARLLAGYGGRLIELNGEEDHIHLLFELPPVMAPSRAVGSLKTQISKEIRAAYPDRIHGKLWKDTFWSASYFLTTTGGASLETVKRYIESQGVERGRGRPKKHDSSPTD